MGDLVRLLPSLFLLYLIVKFVISEIRYRKIVRRNPHLRAAQNEDRPRLWTGLGLVGFGFAWIFFAALYFPPRFRETVIGILAGMGLAMLAAGLGGGLLLGWVLRRHQLVERYLKESIEITSP